MTEGTPSIGISLSAELPGKQSLVLQAFVARDCAVPELDAILDKLRVGIERQAAFGMLQILRLQLEQEEKLQADHAQRMAIVDENIKRDWANGNRRGDVRLSEKQQNEQRQAFAHAEECKKRIAKVKRDIAEFETKIGAQPGA